MTAEDLRTMKKLLLDLRFSQAAALVAAGLSEDKKAIEYMRSITRMEKVIETELKAKEST